MATKISFRVESRPVHRETPVSNPTLHFSLPPINRPLLGLPLLVAAFGPVENRKEGKGGLVALPRCFVAASASVVVELEVNDTFPRYAERENSNKATRKHYDVYTSAHECLREAEGFLPTPLFPTRASARLWSRWPRRASA